MLTGGVRDWHRIIYIHGKNSGRSPHFNEFMRIGNKIKTLYGEKEIKANCVSRWSGYPFSFSSVTVHCSAIYTILLLAYNLLVCLFACLVDFFMEMEGRG